jgi:hypothetical protein
MVHTTTWWHHPWMRTAENVVGHLAAIAVGFAMMIFGLGLGVTMIMLPAGVVIGLAGAAIFVGGIFARITPQDDRP